MRALPHGEAIVWRRNRNTHGLADFVGNPQISAAAQLDAGCGLFAPGLPPRRRRPNLANAVVADMLAEVLQTA
jgi:hypothetical protein